MNTASTDNFSVLYSAYASGTLDPAFALMVETQAQLRADVAEQVEFSEALAGELFEATPPVPVSDYMLEATLAEIDKIAPVPVHKHKRAVDKSVELLDELTGLPAPLLDTVAETMMTESWKSAAPGIRCLKLDVHSDSEVELYRIEPNASVPRHTHGGREYTLVVSGGFTDETGSFGPGDLSLKDATDTHQPVADPGEVCYALAVRNGDLRLTGFLGFMQRLMGR